jgi:hypothetical protein
MRRFAITHDYLCPFARNAAEVVVRALEAGPAVQVDYRAFSLSQVHLAEGEAPVWRKGTEPRSGVLALQWGLAVRDELPERFPAAHLALFAARHDDGLDLRDPEVLEAAMADVGVDVDAVLADVERGTALETVRKEHERAVADHAVFGVPTVIVGDRAAFVRVMHRPRGHGAQAVATVERVLQLVTGWPELNELKHTTIPR